MELEVHRKNNDRIAMKSVGEIKRRFGVLREFLYFCSPKQKVS